jgi:Uma2 family endonuclease
VAHNDIAANVLTALRTALRGTGCRAFGGDLRLRAPGGFFTYPDVMLICGQLELSPDRPDTVVNPAVLVEVLSDATRDYDRGEKFALYKTIPSLREYVLIEQDRVAIDHFQLRAPSNWASVSYSSLADSLSLNVADVVLPLSDVYHDVFGAQME